MVEEVAVDFDFGFDDGPRTDEGHFAAEHVEELGEFVEAPAAEKVTHDGDARIWPAPIFRIQNAC